jgi:colicin import membrane protein
MKPLSISNSLLYSLVIHGLFLGVLIVSWGHIPPAETVQVVLWSGNEVKEAGKPVVKTDEKSPVMSKPVHKSHPIEAVAPKMAKATKLKLSKAPEPDTGIGTRLKKWWSGEDEKADIHIEHKNHKKKPVKKPIEKERETEKSAARFKKVESTVSAKPVPPRPEKAFSKPIEKKEKTVPEKDLSQDKENELEDRLALNRAEAAAEKAAEKRAEAREGEHAESGSGRAGRVDCTKLAGYCSKLTQKIRGNMDWLGDEEVPQPAIFEVALLPNGEVTSVKLKRSSGSHAYDKMAERAISEASPFPRPDSGIRVITIRMKP